MRDYPVSKAALYRYLMPRRGRSVYGTSLLVPCKAGQKLRERSLHEVHGIVAPMAWRLILDSRVVIDQVWRNRLLLQAFHGGATDAASLEKAIEYQVLKSCTGRVRLRNPTWAWIPWSRSILVPLQYI